MQALASLDDIIGRYDAILCDVWGVIHNGRGHFPAAARALTRARERGVVVMLVSNVPKPNGPIPGQLDRAGFPRSAWDGIVTSGDAIRAELAARAPGPMLKLGPEEDETLWAGLGLEFSGIEQARFLGVSGLLYDDPNDRPENYLDLLRAAKARDLEFLCANPDIVVRIGEKLYWCAGALAEEYEGMGGRVVLAGKPHPPIYSLAFRQLETHTGRAIGRERILAIGDGVPTDVAGANAQGLDCLFIASGMHGEALKTDSRLDAGKVEAALAVENVRAQYVMEALT